MARKEKLEALAAEIRRLPEGTKERAAYARLCPAPENSDAPGERVTFDEFRGLWLDMVAERAQLDADQHAEARAARNAPHGAESPATSPEMPPSGPASE